MEDALNSTLQPNTFMDIMVPRAKEASPRSKPDRSNTLMRTGVSRPNFSFSQPMPQATVVPQPTPTQPSASISTHRQNLDESADLTSKSPLISRFPATEQPAAVTSNNTDIGQSGSANITPASFNNLDARPLAVASEQPSINVFNSGQSGAIEYTRPSQSAKIKLNLTKVSGWTAVAVVLIGVVASGIFINRNLNRVELYLASSKAGFSATLPGAMPAGFGLTSIGTGTGTIEASFKSNSDNRTYTISEKKSSVSSQALLASYVQNKAGLNFQTVNTANNTIYIYNGHDATWVKNGIWYVIQDNNSLSDHQIINMANSM